MDLGKIARSQNDWDAHRYDQTVGFVPAFGSAVMDLLSPKAGESVLDLGCGTGHLTARIAEAGARVRGIDASPAMVERARSLFPAIRFTVADARNFTLEEPVDAVFSNAALHWMKPPGAVIACVARCLRPGGRFVAEMGGRGNIATIMGALYTALAEEGVPGDAVFHPWFFPSIGEYAPLLEAGGFEVALMQHFDRPTPLDDCPNGIADWIRMFGGDFLKAAPPGREEQVIACTSELCRPALCMDGRWVADYRRLRFVAIRR